MSGVSAANYIIISIVGGAIAGVSICFISDQLLRRKLPMIVLGTVYLLSWAILVFIYKGKPPLDCLKILLFMIGFSSAASTLGWACGKEVNDSRYAGITTAVINSGGFIGAAVVPLLMGSYLDKYVNVLGKQQLYGNAFMICFASAAIGYIFAFFIKETYCKNIYSRNKQILMKDS
jgi:hypothetical protein